MRTYSRKRAITILASVLCLFLIVGSALADNKDSKEKKEITEEDMGFRKGSLYEEESVKPEHGEYSKTKPGKSKKMERAFENSPPLIPHDLTGMLPIAETNNMCLGCHMPDEARSIGATPVPRSHLVDFATGEDLKGKLDGKRYDCMQCHAPQVDIPEPIKNTFSRDFRKGSAGTGSDLIDSLNEGVEPD